MFIVFFWLFVLIVCCLFCFCIVFFFFFFFFYCFCFFFFFFFSSRRRHTRCSRDWSSDVCSSDLRRKLGVLIELGHVHPHCGAVRYHQHAHHSGALDPESSGRIGHDSRRYFHPVLHVGTIHFHDMGRFRGIGTHRGVSRFHVSEQLKGIGLALVRDGLADGKSRHGKRCS